MRWAKALNATRPMLQVVPSVSDATADLFAETNICATDMRRYKPI
jgi:hypothetical protein